MGRLDGSVAVVTGGSRGLGEAIVEVLHGAGATVVVGDVRSVEGERLVARLEERVHYQSLDVTLESEWVAAVEGALERFGRIDILVNNAGVGGGLTPIGTYSSEQYQRVVAVNQTGVFLGMRAVAPTMIEAGQGSIVNIGSVEGLHGMANFVAYCGSKHAVVGMSRAAALELAPFGVRVNSVCPGPIATPGLLKGTGEAAVSQLADLVPMGRLAEPAEIARAVLFLAGSESSYCTGSELVVDGGWTAGKSPESGRRKRSGGRAIPSLRPQG